MRKITRENKAFFFRGGRQNSPKRDRLRKVVRQADHQAETGRIPHQSGNHHPTLQPRNFASMIHILQIRTEILREYGDVEKAHPTSPAFGAGARRGTKEAFLSVGLSFVFFVLICWRTASDELRLVSTTLPPRITCIVHPPLFLSSNVHGKRGSLLYSHRKLPKTLCTFKPKKPRSGLVAK
jgi:hypothetical protein